MQTADAKRWVESRRAAELRERQADLAPRSPAIGPVAGPEVRRSRSAAAPVTSALKALAGALDEAGVPAMIIGGIAVIARGVPRRAIDDATVHRGLAQARV